MDFSALFGIHLQTVLTFNGLVKPSPPPPLHVTAVFHETNHDWWLLNDKHWQIVPTTSEDPVVDPVCGPNMIEIKGWMKQDLDTNPYGAKTVEALQKTTCLKWIERKEPLDKCAKYDRQKWLEISSKLPAKYMHFCINKFEGFNAKKQFPPVMINLLEAESICNAQNKRLCNEKEWEFACEGQEAIPYGYGYERDSQKCAIDKTWRQYHESAFFPRNTSRLAAELDYLWQGEPSGARFECKSPFGVMDMNANVDEITISVRAGSRLALKGGYFSGHVRNRCRAATRSHDQNFAFYQVSFRCCSDL